jgi:hypothetical protein
MSIEENLIDSFEAIYNHIDEIKIKEKVDQIGIEAFINQCARYAAATGAMSGIGGFVSTIVGLPADLINNIIQEFRVTLGVIYHKTGRYKISFVEFMKIVGASLGIEAAMTGMRVLMLEIAKRIIIRVGAGTAGKLIPLFGTIIGGGVNYVFIRSIGAAVMSINIRKYALREIQEGEEDQNGSLEDERIYQPMLKSETC